MYHRFTDRARKVMQLANQEAQRFNHEYIDPAHILLGLVKEGAGVAARALISLGVEIRGLRLEMERVMTPGPDIITMGPILQTLRTRQAMEAAIDEASVAECIYVGTEHILLGLVCDADSTAGKMLAGLGIAADKIREKIGELLAAGKKNPDAPPVEGWSMAIKHYIDPDVLLGNYKATVASPKAMPEFLPGTVAWEAIANITEYRGVTKWEICQLNPRPIYDKAGKVMGLVFTTTIEAFVPIPDEPEADAPLVVDKPS